MYYYLSVVAPGMIETPQKYELLALLPLNATDDELKAQAKKVEARISAAGGVVHASTVLQKGRLAYPVNRIHQGYYYTIQFEINPQVLPEFRRMLVLSGEVVRFTVAKVRGAFKTFVPSAPRTAPARAYPNARPMSPSHVLSSAPISSSSAPTLTQEAVKPNAAPKVTMEELDKRLEEILGE